VTPGELERGSDGVVFHGEVRAGGQVVLVDDADTHHARSVQAGAEIIEAPIDQAYGVREYGARDPQGQLWYFHSPLG
jgi:predicted enzyme related to lactoylglutathione lyase